MTAEKAPVDADAICRQVERLLANNKVKEAVGFLVNAIKQSPNIPSLQFLYATICFNQGEFKEAQRFFDRALRVWKKLSSKTPPSNAMAISTRLALHRGDKKTAAQVLARGLKAYPNATELLALKGYECFEAKQLQQAAVHFEAAINLEPKKADYQFALGRVLDALGDSSRAERVYRDCYLNPKAPRDTILQLANVLQKLDKFEDSLKCYHRALQVIGIRHYLYSNMGALFNKMGVFDKALQSYKRAACLTPEEGGTYYNLGNLYRGKVRLEDAISAYRRAIATGPNQASYHWNLALALLLAGDLEEGFEEYEWRWDFEGFPSLRRNFSQPMWDGANFDGKTLLVHAEQGMGDHFQFLRFLADIATRKGKTGRIILECHTPLMRLIPDYPGVDQVVERLSDLPDFDVQLPLLSAPLVLGVKSNDDIPNKVPYLSVPKDEDFPLPEADPEKFKIGFVWGGNPQFSGDATRSAKIEYFQTLFEIENTQFFSMQKGEREPELAMAPPQVVRLSDRIADFSDTAIAMQKMDLIISTCTSVAHLAGGLGCPTWVALSYTNDWRWLTAREDSPWYPTVRLFRQPEPGDWRSVFAALETAIRVELKKRR